MKRLIDYGTGMRDIVATQLAREQNQCYNQIRESRMNTELLWAHAVVLDAKLAFIFTNKARREYHGKDRG